MTPDEMRVILEEMQRIAKIPNIPTSTADTQWQLPKRSYAAMKGRQMGKTQALKDKLNALDAHRMAQAYVDAYPDRWDRCPTCSDVVIDGKCRNCYFDMPTLYPTLKRIGLIVSLELPPHTPAACVMELHRLLGKRLHKLDDYRCEFPYRDFNAVKQILESQFGKINWDISDAPDPNGPHELVVEYVGQCRSHAGEGMARSVVCSACQGTGLNARGPKRGFLTNSGNCSTCNGQGRIVSTEGESYASGWVNDGWHVRFPEKVLRAYFGEPEVKFDGDFYRALLSSSDLSRSYKQLARKFHPDLNRARDAVQQFHKLKEAYDVLRDPLRRKRYQAGLAFQQQSKPDPKEITFKVPVSCGKVVVRGLWEEAQSYNPGTINSVGRGQSWQSWADADNYAPTTHMQRLNVTEIVKWDSIVNAQGQVMVATWDGGGDAAWKQSAGVKPFTTTWEDKYEVEFDVTI